MPPFSSIWIPPFFLFLFMNALILTGKTNEKGTGIATGTVTGTVTGIMNGMEAEPATVGKIEAIAMADPRA